MQTGTTQPAGAKPQQAADATTGAAEGADAWRFLNIVVVEQENREGLDILSVCVM